MYPFVLQKKGRYYKKTTNSINIIYGRIHTKLEITVDKKSSDRIPNRSECRQPFHNTVLNQT
jgi:hypothetical protein